MDVSNDLVQLNELIGYHRDLSEHDKSLKYSEKALSLIDELQLTGTISHATTLLNVANAYRAAGLHKESLKAHNDAYQIYKETLEPNDERIASFYNNLSLLYQEMEQFERAVACQKKALEIVSALSDQIKIAITNSNLGASLLQLGHTKEAIYHLELALDIFNQSEEKDFHYNAAMLAMGNAQFTLGNLDEARKYYQIALNEQFKHCGKSDAFYRILENLNIVEHALQLHPTSEDDFTSHLKGLDLSEMYFEEVGKPAILKEFPDIFDQISCGLVGEGSECFGFDDEISTDHDFGPAFCIWMPCDLYEKHGAKLQALYDSLPKTYKGYNRIHKAGEGRVGVWNIDTFFETHTGYKNADGLSDADATFSITDDAMATILNGRLFHDPNQQFESRRQAFYDAFTDQIWNLKIAKALIQLGQYGQSNYPRAMKRKDYVSAQITLYKYIETLLQFVHYINHKFPPYYKWLKKSASHLERLAVLSDLTLALADFADGREAWKEDSTGHTDKVCGTIEIIAGLIIHELKDMGLLAEGEIPSEELFLEVYGKALYQKAIQNAPTTNKRDKDCLVEEIVHLEWQAFDQVENIGGRADCQNDLNTFTIMRKSQYLTWPEELLLSFIEDFKVANKRGWNLITEKYARMMQSTSPEEYDKIAKELPEITDAQYTIIEQIVAVQVAWMEAFAKEYPHLAASSRSIHTSEDTMWNTSYETYLRGELSTYSPKTLKLYGSFIVGLARNGENLAKMTMTNTVNLYGYESLEDAERNMT